MVWLVQSVQSCPFDSTPIQSKLPENEAILGLIALNGPNVHQNSSHGSLPNCRNTDRTINPSYDCVEIKDIPHYRKCTDCIKQMALLLRPQQPSKQTIATTTILINIRLFSAQQLSRPMQRKLIILLHCQIVEGEGRTRAMRNVRSIGERALAELLIKHQDSHQLRFILL